MSGNQNVFAPVSSELKAITINGAIHVECEEDRRRREERRKQRKSRWGAQGQGQGQGQGQTAVAQFPPAPKRRSGILLDGERALTAEQRAAAARQEQKNAAKAVTLPTAIDAGQMDERQQKVYLLNMQIQEISSQLSKPDLGIPANPRDRSPSPEPIYNSSGKRMNTRMDRTRSKLVNQRNACITRLKELDPTYQPPSQYRYKNAQLEEKVPIPADEHPHINFVGLILGPRGNSLEAIKARTNTVIAIRGKGSLKDGMSGISKHGKVIEHLDEPMHAYITGPTVEAVKAAADEINELIEMQVYHPDSEKAVALRAKHMHELAILNGTLREFDVKCLNCGAEGHKSWECSEKAVFTSSVICQACGGVGHVTADCKQQRPGAAFNFKSTKDKETIDKEYDAFLNDLVGDGRDKAKRKKEDAPYVPPMGILSQSSVAPLMLTNGSAKPGAASAHARAISAGKHTQKQKAGGRMEVVGESIFGGKMTKMTSGYKTQREIEREQELKKLEAESQHVPLEWRVAKYEQKVNKDYEDYMKQLEEQMRLEKERKAKEEAMKAAGSSASRHKGPPPLPPPGSRTATATSDADDGLPKLGVNPYENLKRT